MNTKSNQKSKFLRRSRRYRKKKGVKKVFDNEYNRIKRFPLLPNQLCTALKWQENFNYAGSTVTKRNYYGLLEFLNQVPGYGLQLYQIYKYCRVTGVEIFIELQNAATESVSVTLGVCDWPDFSGLNAVTFAQTPGAENRLLGSNNAASRVIYQRSFNPYAVLGQKIASLNYAMTVSQAQASTPLDANEPVIALVMEAVDGTSTWSIAGTVTTVYHVEFFDLYTSNA